MDKKTQTVYLDAAKREGLYLPTEDINRHVQEAIDMACFMAIENNGLQPMLDVVMRRATGDIEHVGVVIEGVDFNDHTQKLKALFMAGKQMGKDFSETMLPMQVTLLTEAWQRNVAQAEEDKREVVMAASRSWDGREGFISRRTVRDLEDTITDTCPALEHLATEETDKPTPILQMFFVGFGIGVSEREGIDLDLKIEAQKIETAVSKLFG